ncbi:unnamed protein product [Polarella glacialis]|uniref:Uncharacterized protein n=1 Tax=Polarella glacialis TaxID=89957 RepID=A0A813DKR7_POLGL|nr:unnamed protein product [Polarella glacialis]
MEVEGEGEGETAAGGAEGGGPPEEESALEVSAGRAEVGSSATHLREALLENKRLRSENRSHRVTAQRWQRLAEQRKAILHTAQAKLHAERSANELLTRSLSASAAGSAERPSNQGDIDWYVWQLLGSGMRDLDNPDARKAALWDGVLVDWRVTDKPKGIAPMTWKGELPSDWKTSFSGAPRPFRRSRPRRWEPQAAAPARAVQGTALAEEAAPQPQSQAQLQVQWQVEESPSWGGLSTSTTTTSSEGLASGHSIGGERGALSSRTNPDDQRGEHEDRHETGPKETKVSQPRRAEFQSSCRRLYRLAGRGRRRPPPRRRGKEPSKPRRQNQRPARRKPECWKVPAQVLRAARSLRGGCSAQVPVPMKLPARIVQPGGRAALWSA